MTWENIMGKCPWRSADIYKKIFVSVMPTEKPVQNLTVLYGFLYKKEYLLRRLTMFKDIPAPTKTLKNRLGRELKEKDIEDYGAKGCRELGWEYEKFVSPQRRSVPDRMVTIPGAQGSFELSEIFFIEFKAPFEEPTKLQKLDHDKRRKMGTFVFVVDCYEEMDLVIKIMDYVTQEYPLSTFEIPYFLLS